MADDVVGGLGSGLGRTERLAELKATETKESLRAQDRSDIAGAADRVRDGQVQGAAATLTREPRSDGFDPATNAGGTPSAATPVVGGGAGAREYGNLDPTRGRGLQGTSYTPKVLEQMRQGDHHAFPSLVDGQVRGGDSFAFRNGDGKVRGGIEVPGQVNGKPGNYQWIVNENGRDVNHRLFVPDKGTNPIARDRIIPHTAAARVAGRAMLGVGLAMDGLEIAQSNDKVRTTVEKAGAWAGATGGAALAGQLAAPALAVPGYGWAAYGAAVLAGGAAGYFLGEEGTKRAYGWLMGR